MPLVSTGQLTIVDISDGISANLINDSYGVPADSAGTVSSFVGVETQFKIIEGTTDTTETWTYYVSARGSASISYRDIDDTSDRTGTGEVDGLLSGNSGYLRVTQLGVDSSYLDITAKKTGRESITKRFSVTKNKQGIVGNDSVVYYVSPSASVISKNSPDRTTDGAHTPSSLVFSVYKVVGNNPPQLVTDESVYYHQWNSPTAEPSTNASQLSSSGQVTVNITDNSSRSDFNFKLYDTVTKTVLLDYKTVPVVFKGNDGFPGDPAYQVVFARSVEVITTDQYGSKNSITLPTDNTVVLQAGDTILTPNGSTVVVSVVNSSPYINPRDGLTLNVSSTGAITYSIGTDWTPTSEYTEFKIKITYNSTDYFGYLKLNRAKASRRGSLNITKTVTSLESLPLIYKQATNAATSGIHTSISVTGKQVSGNTSIDFGWLTSTPNGSTESARVNTANTPLIIAPTNTEGKTSYTVKMYSASSGGTLLSSTIIPVLFKDSTNITIAYTNEYLLVPVDNDTGTIYWENSGGVLQVYEGTTLLTLNSNNQTTSSPSLAGYYNINIARISGNTLTEPSISGTDSGICTIGEWNGSLTSTTVYRITAYIRKLNGTTTTITKDLTILPNIQTGTNTSYFINNRVDSSVFQYPLRKEFRAQWTAGIDNVTPIYNDTYSYYADTEATKILCDSLGYVTNTSYLQLGDTVTLKNERNFGSYSTSNITSFIAGDILGIEEHNGYLVALVFSSSGTETRIYYSTNSTNTSWTLAKFVSGVTENNAIFSDKYTSLKRQGGSYFCYSKFTNKCLISTNGIQWSEAAPIPAATNISVFDSISNRDKVLVVYNSATGGTSYVAKTNNFSTWEISSAISNITYAKCISYSPKHNRYVIGGDSGKIAYSDSNSEFSFTSISPVSSGTIRSIAYGNGVFVAVISTGLILISYDGGITWTLGDTEDTIPANDSAVITYLNNIFILSIKISVTTNKYIYTSYDGITWESSISAENSGVTNSILYSEYEPNTLILGNSPQSGQSVPSITRVPLLNIASVTGYWDGLKWAHPGVYIDGNLLVKGSVTADSLSANSVTADKIVANSITADKIASSSKINITKADGTNVQGYFKLGSSESIPIGPVPAIGQFVSESPGAWASASINTYSTAGVFANGGLNVSFSPTGTALGTYSVSELSTSYVNMRSYSTLSLANTISAVTYTVGASVVNLKQASWTGQPLDNSGGSAPNNFATRYYTSSITLGEESSALNAAYWNPSGTDNLIVNATNERYALLQSLLSTQYDGLATFIRRYQNGSTVSEKCRIVFSSNSTTDYAIEIKGPVDGATYTQNKIKCPGGVTTFTGIHESYSDSTFELGDILIDAELLSRQDISNCVFSCELSNIENQKGVIGVFSGHENYPTEPSGTDMDGNPLPLPNWFGKNKRIFINSVGEGQINVCGQSGNIEKGDLIVTSNIPGKGMKQSDDIVRNYTVAKARENVAFDYTTQIKQIACIYLCG